MRTLKVAQKLTRRDTNSFNLYLKEIYELEVLTIDEETVLTKKASLGDKAAKDELVKRNLRFVVSVAKQLANKNNPLEDLINEGNIGLMIAADKFKPEMGWKFISYAVWWIRKVIYEHINQHDKIIRLPANKINSLSKLNKKINLLEQKLGRNVDIQEVADEFGKDFASGDYELINMINTYSFDSLDREIDMSDGNHTTLGDLIIDENPSFKSTDSILIDANLKEEVIRILNTLKPRDGRIITALYGLDGNTPMTLKEVGDEIGVTREMIRQIKEKVLLSLKNKIKNTTMCSYH